MPKPFVFLLTRPNSNWKQHCILYIKQHQQEQPISVRKFIYNKYLTNTCVFSPTMLFPTQTSSQKEGLGRMCKKKEEPQRRNLQNSSNNYYIPKNVKNQTKKTKGTNWPTPNRYPPGGELRSCAEDRFISKMFLRGDSVILVLRNPKWGPKKRGPYSGGEKGRSVFLGRSGGWEMFGLFV